MTHYCTAIPGSLEVPCLSVHAVDGLPDPTRLDQVIQDGAARTKAKEPLKERRASKQSLQRKNKIKTKTPSRSASNMKAR